LSAFQFRSLPPQKTPHLDADRRVAEPRAAPPRTPWPRTFRRRLGRHDPCFLRQHYCCQKRVSMTAGVMARATPRSTLSCRDGTLARGRVLVTWLVGRIARQTWKDVYCWAPSMTRCSGAASRSCPSIQSGTSFTFRGDAAGPTTSTTRTRGTGPSRLRGRLSGKKDSLPFSISLETFLHHRIDHPNHL